MALQVTQGMVNTSSTPSSASQVRSVDPRIIFKQASTAPVLALLRAMGKGAKPINWKHEWVEKDLGTPLATVSGAVAAGDATVTVASSAQAAMFRPYDIIYVPSTGETLSVGAAGPTAAVIPIDRSVGATAAAAIADGASLVLLGSAFLEGSATAVARTLNPSMPYNYTQIFKDTAQATKTECATENYAWKMPIMVDRRSDAMIMHMESIERAFFWSEISRATGGTTPRNTLSGLREWITSNLTDCVGAFTKAKFDAFLENVFLNSGPKSRKVIMCSGDLLDAINTEVLTNSNMNIVPATKEWGLDVRVYASPYGKVELVYHRILSQVQAGYGYCLDLGYIEELALRPTRVNMNIGTPGSDYFQDEIITETTLQLACQDSHGIIYNP